MQHHTEGMKHLRPRKVFSAFFHLAGVIHRSTSQRNTTIIPVLAYSYPAILSLSAGLLSRALKPTFMLSSQVFLFFLLGDRENQKGTAEAFGDKDLFRMCQLIFSKTDLAQHQESQLPTCKQARPALCQPSAKLKKL